jgi:hypothetical protein
METILAVLVPYVEDDKDLCTIGLSCRWMYAIVREEMTRRHPEAAAGNPHYAFKLGYPPFVAAAVSKSKMPRQTIELLADCIGPTMAGRIAMKRRREGNLYAMNAFAVIVRRCDGQFYCLDEHVLERIASFVLDDYHV